jgi:pimeloyl-ACP methyl ester carboxylesterase
LLRHAFAALAIERPIVIGHSWGTLVALALALAQPDAVGGLVLLSGYYQPTLRADVPLFLLPAIPVRRLLTLYGRTAVWCGRVAPHRHSHVLAGSRTGTFRQRLPSRVASPPLANPGGSAGHRQNGVGNGSNASSVCRIEHAGHYNGRHKGPRHAHYAWTGNEDAILQVQFIGPGGIDYINPADDPRKNH